MLEDYKVSLPNGNYAIGVAPNREDAKNYVEKTLGVKATDVEISIGHPSDIDVCCVYTASHK